MRLSLTTPILRSVVRKLHDLDNKAAETLLKADNYIKSNKYLKVILSNEAEDDLRLVRPFLNEQLIKETITACLKSDRCKEGSLTPDTMSSWLERKSLEEAAEARKNTCSCAKKG
jgi:hypothetical protein